MVITKAVEHALDGFGDAGESAAGSSSSHQLGDTAFESACSQEEKQFEEYIRNPGPKGSLGDEKLLIGENSQENETKQECRSHHTGTEVHAGEALRSAMVFRDRAHLDAPPEAAVNLDIPIFPTGIERVVPTFAFEGLNAFLKEALATMPVFTPETEIGDAASGWFEMLFRTGARCRRVELKFQPIKRTGHRRVR